MRLHRRRATRPYVQFRRFCDKGNTRRTLLVVVECHESGGEAPSSGGIEDMAGSELGYETRPEKMSVYPVSPAPSFDTRSGLSLVMGFVPHIAAVISPRGLPREAW